MFLFQKNENEDCPIEISSLVGKTFLFKVEKSEAYDGSFGVKKLIEDPIILQKFVQTSAAKLADDPTSKVCVSNKYVLNSIVIGVINYVI